MPTRAERNAALRDVTRLTQELKICLDGLDKDTEWLLMSQHPAFLSTDFTAEIPELTDRLENLRSAADSAWQLGKRETGPLAVGPIFGGRALVKTVALAVMAR